MDRVLFGIEFSCCYRRRGIPPKQVQGRVWFEVWILASDTRFASHLPCHQHSPACIPLLMFLPRYNIRTDLYIFVIIPFISCIERSASKWRRANWFLPLALCCRLARWSQRLVSQWNFSPVSHSYRPSFLLHTTFVQDVFNILSKHRNGRLEFEENKERIVEGCQQAGCGMAGGISSSPPRQRFCRGERRVSILTAMTGM